MVMFVRPSMEVELMFLMPSMVITESSSTSAMEDSMVSGEAPTQVTVTVMTGKSTSGIWLIPMRLKPMAPKMMRPNMRIQANTVFFMEMSDRVMPVAGSFLIC